MYQEIKLILGLACIVVLFINSEPTIRLREWVYKSIYKCKSYNVWHYRLVCCAMCTGFWFGLAMTLDPILAALVSITAELISRKINS